MNLGVTVQVNMPLTQGGTPVGNFTDRLNTYSHTIDSLGGFREASFSVTSTVWDLEEWLEQGLMRDIVTYDEAGRPVFEGFVNSMTLTFGGRSIEYGPVLDITNRTYVVYSTIDTSVSPPVVGNRTRTSAANDLDSQTRFGILEEAYSSSGVSDANALALRDTFLKEYAWPELTETLSTEGVEPILTVHCLGYGELLNKFIYNLRSSASVNVSSKLIAVLNAEPNHWLSDTTLGITTNTMQVSSWENDDRRGMEIIKGLVAMGDSASNRWLFGVYAGRQVVYGPAPTEYSYQYRLSEDKLERYGGSPLQPYEVLPGRWLFYPDFMAGRNSSAVLRQDPRGVFIESVTYTAPRSLSINGGKLRRMPQLLARLGLGGVS